MEASSRPSLNDDVIAEILVRTTPKTLHRSSCVCENWWKNMISDPNFKKRFVTKLKTQMPLVTGFFTAFSSVKEFSNLNIIEPGDTSFSFLPEAVKFVIASDKGLVLCSTNSQHDVVCNPITKQWVYLPRTFGVLCGESILYCYEKREATTTVKQIEFKVVVFKKHNEQVKVATFSSETQKWGSSNTFIVPDNIEISLDTKVLFKESVYFVADTYLIAYDLEEQALRSLGLPLSNGNRKSLGVSAGSLYYCSSDGAGNFKVWVYVDGCEWSLKHDIYLTGLGKLSPFCVYHLGYHPLNPNIMLLGFTSVFSYNIRTGEIKLINENNSFGKQVIPYCLPGWIWDYQFSQALLAHEFESRWWN